MKNCEEQRSKISSFLYLFICYLRKENEEGRPLMKFYSFIYLFVYLIIYLFIFLRG